MDEYRSSVLKKLQMIADTDAPEKLVYSSSEWRARVLMLLNEIAENGGGGGGTGGNLPSGGTAGQFLVKQSATDYDANWETKDEEITISTAGAVTQALDAGKIYHFTGALTELTITLAAPASGVLAQYHFDFDSGATAPTFTMPNTVTMPDSFSVEANKHYEIDILNGYGAVIAWAIS